MPIELPAKIAFLKKIHLFHGLEEDELAAIAAELQEAPVAKGEVVFQQDKKADSFYLIYGGASELYADKTKRNFNLRAW